MIQWLLTTAAAVSTVHLVRQLWLVRQRWDGWIVWVCTIRHCFPWAVGKGKIRNRGRHRNTIDRQL